MNTFHISPSDPLASDAVDQVREFPPDCWIAVRGEEFDGAEYVYTVSACPDQENPGRYVWTYVRAGEWLDEFYAHQEK